MPRTGRARAATWVAIGLLALAALAALTRTTHPTHDGKSSRAAPEKQGEAASPGPAPAPADGSPSGPANARSPIGYNLDFPGDWSLLRPFIDLMHNARPFAGACSDGDPQCDRFAHLRLDEQGWPRSLQYRDNPALSYAHVETVFSTTPAGPERGKVFVVTWEGTGDLEVFGGEPLKADPKPRRLRFRFLGGNTILRILRTDPRGQGDHVRNVRICREDLEPLLDQGELFNPDTLAYLEPFGSLRFMDWMLSNDPEEREARWSERPRPDRFPWIRQTLDPAAPCDTLERPACRCVGGYPVEVLVGLANRLGADPHFNMPYRADDDWVKQFAAYVRDHLARNLRATVEYGNEVWNWGFPQAGYAKHEAEALWPSESTGWLQFMGARASRTCQLWKGVFRGQEARVRCVIAPQTGWVEIANAALDCPAWVAHDPSRNRPCHEGMDAVAITGYFGSDLMTNANHPVLRSWLSQGPDFARAQAFRYLDRGEAGGLLDEAGQPLGSRHGASAVTTIAHFARWGRIAAERGLPLYLYEGGTHFGSDDPELRPFLASLATDPRMYALYRRVLDAYRAAGGTVWNAWGALGPGDAWSNGESLADRGNAKYRALLDFAQTNPCWWRGCDRSAR